jgi:hypothetical protein
MVEQGIFDPSTVRYVAMPGEIAKTRSLDEIKKACDIKGFTLGFSEPGDCLAALTEPSIVTVWDEKGRVVRNRFLGDRGMVGARQFDNLYYFDDEGRLVILEQQVMDQTGYVRLYKADEYTYLEGRPDKEYTLTHTDTFGKKSILSYERRMYERKLDLLSDGKNSLI